MFFCAKIKYQNETFLIISTTVNIRFWQSCKMRHFKRFLTTVAEILKKVSFFMFFCAKFNYQNETFLIIIISTTVNFGILAK